MKTKQNKARQIKMLLMPLALFAFTANAQIVNIPDAAFKTRLINNGVDTNADGEIQVFEAQAITFLDVSHTIFLGNSIIDMTGIQSFTNVTELYCDYNQISNLNLSGMTNLFDVVCSNNPMVSLTLNNMDSLHSIQCNLTQLTALDVSSCPNLFMLKCDESQLTSLNMNGLQNLSILYCDHNQLSSLDVNNITSLTQLNCTSNLLTSLNVDALTNLTSFFYGSPALAPVNYNSLVNLVSFGYSGGLETNMNLSHFPNLQLFWLWGSNITTIDASMLPNLYLLRAFGNPALTSINIKNGGQFTFSPDPLSNFATQIRDNNNLLHICTNENDLAGINLQLVAINNNGSAHASTYCSFTPGGNFNTIHGIVRFDADGNGCDETDNVNQNIRINITDGIQSGGTFTDGSGIYNFYTGNGTFTITPSIENAEWFSFSPDNPVIPFVDDNNNQTTQNFCISPNGIHNDVEVVLSPITRLRPGFDSTYQLIYKNKGNQTLSGNVNLIFDDARLDFVSALPAVDNQAANGLTWNYNNLLPFESRAIDLVLNANSPLENPAVNSGDVLNFTAAITPIANDGFPEDNIFEFNQTAVNAFDPNEKTCLEGDFLSPQQIGKYLHYAINFENLGTSEAVNVVVRDSIDVSKFDISSLQVIHASNEVETKIKGNVVEFIFRNINLAPLSGDPPVGGHGSILFKIRTLPTLTHEDEVSNEADIYFDYNAPVATNAARTRFSLLRTPGFIKDDSVVLSPNPTKDYVKIECNSAIRSIELYDIQGRILETKLENKSATQLNISAKAKGIYFVKITTDEGKAVEKVVKE